MEDKIQKAKKHKDDAKLSRDKALEKAEKLKYNLRNDVRISNEQYLCIMNEVHEYEMSLKDAVNKMKHSQTTFLEAHSSTLEVLKVADEIGITDKRFHKQGERRFECMFCTKRFDTHHVRKHHILMYHWKDWDSKVSNNYLNLTS